LNIKLPYAYNEIFNAYIYRNRGNYMSDLLHIAVSPMGDHSISRAVDGAFIEAFKARHATADIITHDLAIESIPHLDGEAIGAGYTPEDARSVSAAAKHNYRLGLIKEVNEAKHILVSTPMWNFSVPSVLKAWIDQIIIPGAVAVTGKVTVIISQGGSYAPGAPRAGWDWESGFMKQLFESIGATDIEVIVSEFGLAGIAPGLEAFVDNKAASIAAAKTAAAARASL
jgi:FMN-dependent NADH-azoreductase